MKLYEGVTCALVVFYIFSVEVEGAKAPKGMKNCKGKPGMRTCTLDAFSSVPDGFTCQSGVLRILDDKLCEEGLPRGISLLEAGKYGLSGYKVPDGWECDKSFPKKCKRSDGSGSDEEEDDDDKDDKDEDEDDDDDEEDDEKSTTTTKKPPKGKKSKNMKPKPRKTPPKKEESDEKDSMEDDDE